MELKKELEKVNEERLSTKAPEITQLLIGTGEESNKISILEQIGFEDEVKCIYSFNVPTLY